MIYVIGDIHGHSAGLDRALGLIEADGGPDARVVFLGDYTDRGPDSRGVVERLVAGAQGGRNWVVLRGNHDRMFTRFVEAEGEHDPRISSGKGWLHPDLGGPTTLASYGVDALRPDVQAAAHAAVPRAHIAFLQSRPLWHQEDGYLFVHAGIRPGIALADQDEDDLIWIRSPFLEHQGSFGPMVVHGHSADQTPTAYHNRLNFDGGAGYGRALVPGVIGGGQAFILTDAGRQPMPRGD